MPMTEQLNHKPHMFSDFHLGTTLQKQMHTIHAAKRSGTHERSASGLSLACEHHRPQTNKLMSASVRMHLSCYKYYKTDKNS
jgi:hypothetical protein